MPDDRAQSLRRNGPCRGKRWRAQADREEMSDPAAMPVRLPRSLRSLGQNSDKARRRNRSPTKKPDRFLTCAPNTQELSRDRRVAQKAPLKNNSKLSSSDQ